MRAADLLGATVLAPDGRRLGEVLDVRLVQDGPLLGASCALRVDGFVVGSRRLSAHLGYDRAGVRGPALVASVVRRLNASTRYLPWDEVAALDAGTVRARRGDLGPVPRLVSSG